MRWSTATPAVVGTVLTLASASAARAGNAMFQASFIMHAFGNDVTTGIYFPFNTSVFVPMPLGTTGCAPYYPYSAGYHPCLSSSQRGKAATGTGLISVVTTGTGPAPIALPQSAFGVTTVGFWPLYFPQTYYTTYATFVNESGSFLAGGGFTSYTFSGIGYRKGTWFLRPGPNRFGGAMGLLGKLGARAVFASSGTPVAGTSSWNMIKALGRNRWGMDTMNPYTNTGMFANAAGTKTVTYTAIATGTRWGTGSVTIYVESPAPSYITILHRAGYDTTTPGGVRNIQLVTPALTHWLNSGYRSSTAHIGVLKIQVPEPHAMLLLAVGVGVLAVLRGVTRRG